MDETLLGWIFLLGMLLWRSICRCHCVQWLLHSCGLGALFQWYNLTWAGLVLLLVRTVFDIVKYDYIGFHFLSQDKIYEKISQVCEGTKREGAACDQLRAELHIPPWLHGLSLAAPVFGTLGFLILTSRLHSFVRLNVRVATGQEELPQDEGEETSERMPYELASRLEWVVIILGTPLIFIVMAMRSLIRIWTVMTGTAFHEGVDWDTIVRLELATYEMDLELSVAFQFYACLMFGLLCTSFLEHSRMVTVRSSDGGTSTQRYMRIVAYTAVQGVYAFVFIGFLRTVFDIAVTYISEMPQYHEKAELLQDKVLSKVATIFSFVTLLCMLNMFLISKVPDIEEGLKGANPKFTGVRLLLLITQIQPQVLKGITIGSPLYESLRANAHKLHLQEMFEKWTFTPKQALLAHAAALNYECLFVALLTYMLWSLGDTQKKALMKDLSKVARAREVRGEGYQRLLDA